MLPRMHRWVLLSVLAVVHFTVLVWMSGKVKTAIYGMKSRSTLALTRDHTRTKINTANVKKFVNIERRFSSNKLQYDEGSHGPPSSVTRHITKLDIDVQMYKNDSTKMPETVVSGVGKTQSTSRRKQGGDEGLSRDGGDGGKNLERESLQKQNGKSTESPNVCGNFQKPAIQVMDQIFQPIAGSHSFVFSAFAMKEDAVRAVLVYDKSDKANAFSCNYRHNPLDIAAVTELNSMSFSVLDKVQGKVKLILDDHGLPYTAAFLNCPMPQNVSTVRNLSLSITYGACRKPPTNLLPVQIPPSQISWEFTVCIAPFHSNYNETDELVEMIELNRILGAEHFYFYNESSSKGVAKVLEYYQKEGLVNLIQWHLPHEHPKSQSNLNHNRKEKQVNIHYKGQNAAINDCLHRNRNRSKYVVIQDLDEFIIPHNPNITTWSQFVKSRLALDEKKVNFLVRSSNYRKEWIHPGNTFSLLDRAKNFNSKTLQNIQREENIFEHKIRSKYIADPSLVDEGGIHYVHRPFNRLTDEVPTSEAIVHHYRQPNYVKPALRIFDDIVVRRYGEQLVVAVEYARRNIGLT